MAPPQASVVLLTLNEEPNIEACLASLAKQTVKDFEIIIVDAASDDLTVELIRRVQARFPIPIRLEASARRLPIGEARNLGVSLAQAPLVAFLSADAEMEPNWMQEALRSGKQFDMVFGRQVHAPHAWTVGAAVRGLRYHFPDGPSEDPLRYASNVAALYRKHVLQSFPFDAWANAAEDLLLAKRAVKVGFRATYNPAMVVRHHDVGTARQEWRKSVREGEGWAAYRAELGIFRHVVAWAALILINVAMFIALPGPWSLTALLVILWLPALVRATRRAGKMPRFALIKGVLASPLFDVAFATTYLLGLLGRPIPRTPTPTAKATAR